MATSPSTARRARLRLQTSLDPNANGEDDTPTSPELNSAATDEEQQRYRAATDPAAFPVKPGHQNFVLTDPVAFRYLEEDPSTMVLDRRRPLPGYECYLVEQWTTSRTHPTFMITTYTGDSTTSIMVGVLSVPINEETWSPRLRVYFKALNQYHARRRDTPLGILMVTTLSNFPSSLTVIPVPDGDIKKYRFDFFVNEDLKRLGCSGRVGLNLTRPAAATVAKFHQLYRTSEKNDIYQSVLELVKLCQSALTIFGRLEIDYADGLLCDVTERAVNDWWVEIGHERYNVEPHDGILGPTTVAGLLGLLMGARNRLHSVNSPVPKDPFDVQGMKKGISAFQKQQRMPRSRRLDRRTLERLHKASQKAADKDRWAVPKAVKSTIAELSGKGGEMVVDAVARRDRAGIAEIETVDIDRFAQLVYADRAKWLWLGKPIKKHKISDSHDRGVEEVQGDPTMNQGLVFTSDDHGGFTWTSGRKSMADGLPGTREQLQQDRDYDDSAKQTPIERMDGTDGEDGALAFVHKRATTIKDEAKSGFGKVKEAVGFRGHKTKPSTDDTTQTSPSEEQKTKTGRPIARRTLSSPFGSPASPKYQKEARETTPSVEEHSSRLNTAVKRDRSGTTESRAVTDPAGKHALGLPEELQREGTQEAELSHQVANVDASPTHTATMSIAGSTYKGVGLNEVLPADPQMWAGDSNLLRHTVSTSRFVGVQLESRPDNLFPRHLSFSLAEDSVLNRTTLLDNPQDSADHDLHAQLALQQLIAKELKRLGSQLSILRIDTASWTTSHIQMLESVQDQCDKDQELHDSLHEPHLQSVRELQAHSEGILRSEKERLEEGAKEIETIAAKLEYEMDGLRSRVEDVDAAVTDYEKGVVTVENRVVELEKEGQHQRMRCVVQ